MARHDLWTPHTWDDGYVDSEGYFRVYRPDCPTAYSNGYAKRYHVVIWLVTGRKPRRNEIVHHRNEDKLDDRPENLEVVRRSEHSWDHQIGDHVETSCLGCGRGMLVPVWKLRHGRGRTCSHACAGRVRYGT